MDCCSSENNNHPEEMKGGKTKMDRKIVLWIIIGVLFVATLLLVFKLGVVGSSPIGASANAGQTAAASYGGMVGGC